MGVTPAPGTAFDTPAELLAGDIYDLAHALGRRRRARHARHWLRDHAVAARTPGYPSGVPIAGRHLGWLGTQQSRRSDARVCGCPARRELCDAAASGRT